MFITNILNSLIQFIFTVLGWIGKILLQPVALLIMALFPDMTQYVQQVEQFFSEYILKSMAFIREVFFNITGASRPLFTLLIGIYITRILIGPSIRIYKFIINMWGMYKKGATNND